MHLLIDLQQSHLSISKKLFCPLLTCHIRIVSIPSPNSGETVTLLVAKHRITMYVSLQPYLHSLTVPDTALQDEAASLELFQHHFQPPLHIRLLPCHWV